MAGPLSAAGPGAPPAPDYLDRLQAAVELLRTERLAEAEQALLPLLAEAPRHPVCLQFVGILRHAQGRSEEGIALMREALEIAPRSPAIWNNLGNVLRQCQRPDEAAAAYEQGIAVAEGAAAAGPTFNLASLHLRRRRLDLAEAGLRRAIELQPDFAEAWYGLSETLIAQGRIKEGLRANGKAVMLLPSHSVARDQVVRALLLLGENEQAAAVLRDWLADAPEDPVVQHMLAACTGQGVPDRASDAYIGEIFDAFATTFDERLTGLAYRTPQHVADALRAVAGEPAAALDVADIGCGTGLVGPLVRPWARHLVGCDLSVGMLRQAKKRACYDRLHKAELVYYMDTQPAAFDVVTCADTLVYFGVLDDAFAAAARCLRPGGWLVFSVERLDGDADTEHELAPNGRYRHALHYLERALDRAGLDAAQVSPFVARQEAGEPVHSWLVCARRREPAAV